jgi:hypothetical protein
MKSLTTACLTVGLATINPAPGSPSAQSPATVSLSITADRLDGFDVYGRFIYTGNVILVIDGTEISTHSDAAYHTPSRTIELGNGDVRIKLANGPAKMSFTARPAR